MPRLASYWRIGDGNLNLFNCIVLKSISSSMSSSSVGFASGVEIELTINLTLYSLSASVVRQRAKSFTIT